MSEFESDLQFLEDSVDNERRDRISISLEGALNAAPEAHAEVQSLSKATGLPTDIINANLPDAKRQQQLKNFNIQELAKDYPKTSDFIANPDNAAVMYEQLDTLKGIEANSRKSGFTANILKGAANRVNQLTGNLLQMVGKGADEIEEFMTSATGINPGIRFGEDGMSWTWNLDPAETDAQFIGRAISEGQGYSYVPNFTWEKLKGDVTVQNTVGYMVEQGIQSLPDMIAAVYTLPAYIASRTEEMGEERMKNLGIEGDPTWEELSKAFIPAILVSASERLAAKIVFKTGAVKGVAGVAAATGEATLVEGSTEWVQEGMEYLGETLGTKKEITLSDMLDRQFAGLVAGAGMGAGIRGTTSTVEAIANRNASQVSTLIQSTQDQGQIDRLIEYSQSNTLFEQSPEQFQEFLQSMGDDVSIWLPTEVLGQLENPSEYLEALAGDSGVDVQITLEEFITRVAPDEHLMDELRPYVKLSQDTLNAHQIELGETENTFAIRKLLAAAEKEKSIKTEADAIYEQVKDQLIATGRQGTATARLSAQLIPAQVTAYVAKARKLGHDVTVSEVFEKWGFHVVGPSTPTLGEQALTQARETGYEGTSETEATEWTRAEAKGLPMDQESRQLRAQEMGFDTDQVLYHGTTADIKDFKDGHAAQRVQGVYLTKDTKVSDKYTKAEGVKVGAVYPTYVSMSNPATREILDEIGYGLDGSAMKEELISRGYDGVVDDLMNEVIVFNPNQIRSVNAAFDPAYRESANILAQGQDMGDIELEQTIIEQETRETVQTTHRAQDLWDGIQDRKSKLEQLLDCLNA